MKARTSCMLAAVGLALCLGTAADAQPTYTWEYGEGDVTTLPSYPTIQISATDLINGVVPLRNVDLAAGWPNTTNGYVPVDNMPASALCTPSPLNSPNAGHSGFYGGIGVDETGARLADGLVGGIVDSVLSDWLLPSGVFQFDLPAPTDIGEIRVFVQNTDCFPNGRVWQRYDVYISRDTNPDAKERLFTKLIDRVVSGDIVCASPGDGWFPNVNDGSQVAMIGATLTRVSDTSGLRLASNVTSIRFVFWPVSNTQTVNWDQWLGPIGCSGIDPHDVDPPDGDGFRRSFEASIVKEIDVLPPDGVVEICDNEIDDDGDELVDCADPDCDREPPCATVEYCHNGIDDDDDGLIDGEDPDCAPAPWPCAPENCTNGVDDDGNTLVDCDDPDCWDDPACGGEICDNGIDDDGDGLIDCADPDCDNDPACQCVHDPVFDVDDDGDVDQHDFGVFQSCLTGLPAPNPLFDTLPIDCRCMDVTGANDEPDQAVSQDDYGIFERCATGPGISLPDLTCDDPPF